MADLWQIGDTLNAEALEYEAECLYGHGVMLGERLILEDPH